MSGVTDLQIGVLALQGDYAAHLHRLRQLGVSARAVRSADQLHGLQGLILPGGESTAMLHQLATQSLFQPIVDWYHQGGALFGTCAGAILLANEVMPSQARFGLMAMSVVRNAYGRQLSSRVAEGIYTEDGQACECVFIRAPLIHATTAKIVVTCEGQPVCVQQDRCLAATFHPELTSDERLYRHFLTMCV